MGAFVLIVQLKVKPDSVDKFMKLALENAKAARETEPGCKQFDVLVDPQDPAKVAFYEVYDDEAAFEAHQQTAHFKKYIANALQYLEARSRMPHERIAP